MFKSKCVNKSRINRLLKKKKKKKRRKKKEGEEEKKKKEEEQKEEKKEKEKKEEEKKKKNEEEEKKKNNKWLLGCNFGRSIYRRLLLHLVALLQFSVLPERNFYTWGTDKTKH